MTNIDRNPESAADDTEGNGHRFPAPVVEDVDGNRAMSWSDATIKHDVTPMSPTQPTVAADDDVEGNLGKIHP